MGGLVEIRDREALQEALEGMPREASVAVAARSALRVLPLLGTSRDNRRYEDLVFPCFRASAAAWVAGAWQTRASDLRAAARAAVDALDTTNLTFAVSNAAAAAAHAAAAAAAYTAHAAAAAAAAEAEAAVEAAYTAAYVADVATADVARRLWLGIERDVNLFSGGHGSIGRISQQPLWINGAPDLIENNWFALSARMLDEGEHWKVWTEWYADRLAGHGRRPLIEQLEVDRVLIPTKEDWKKGPAHVNAILAELEKKYRKNDEPKGGVRGGPGPSPQAYKQLAVQMAEAATTGNTAVFVLKSLTLANGSPFKSEDFDELFAIMRPLIDRIEETIADLEAELAMTKAERDKLAGRVEGLKRKASQGQSSLATFKNETVVAAGKATGTAIVGGVVVSAALALDNVGLLVELFYDQVQAFRVPDTPPSADAPTGGPKFRGG